MKLSIFSIGCKFEAVDFRLIHGTTGTFTFLSNYNENFWQILFEKQSNGIFLATQAIYCKCEQCTIMAPNERNGS